MTEPTLNSRVAGNIRAELARKGYTQDHLASAMGITRQAIGKRLDGSQTLTLRDVEVIARALQLDPLKLLTD